MTRTTRSPGPFLGAIAGAAATLFAAGVAGRLEDRRIDARFDGALMELTHDIATRMERNYTVLRAAAGLFQTDDAVTAMDFAAFAAALELPETYPSTQGLGFARLHHEGSLADYRPGADPASTIDYLEPLDERNRAAIGFDMFSEPTRREAMERAARTGEIAATGPVILVQEITPDKQSGFLVYHAVAAGASDEENAPAQGWVYMPFRAGNFFAAAARMSASFEDVHFKVFDAAATDVFYFTSPNAPARGADTTRGVLQAAGREWVINARPTAAFLRIHSGGAHYFVLAIGMLATAFTFGALLRQDQALTRARNAESAQRQAREHAEMLMREVNHRAANSLQLTSALLSLRARSLDKPDAQAALAEAQRCIAAVGQVHKRLYTSDAVASVDLCAYLKALVDDIRAMPAAGPQAQRDILFNGETADVTPDEAIAFGIVAAELVSNAMKYAYRPEEAGAIEVRLSAEDAIRLVVRDKGKGMNSATDTPQGSGIGRTIIEAMAEKLGAEFSLEDADPGLRAVLSLPRAAA